MFTIHGYDIDVPLYRVAGEMQRVAEPVIDENAADEA